MTTWHPRFFWRELKAGSSQLLLFILCVFLASLSLSVVSGWRHSVNNAMAEETRKGAGGDVVAFSSEPFSERLLQKSKDYNSILTSEMFTVALSPKNERTLFSKLKAVEVGYPFYGEVPLLSGRNLHQALQEGLVVEKNLLERLEIGVGDQLKVGNRLFRISDLALSEPDRPMGMWGVSPRIFIASDQLDSTGLLRPDSYLERRIHIKLKDPSQASEVAETLSKVAIPDQERVETWERPPVNMRRFVDNFFVFLDMMSVLAVALGGLGMQSTLGAWLRGRGDTIAITRTLGAKTGFVLRHYTAIVLSSASLGYGLGLAGAGSLLIVSGDYLSQMLPVQVSPRLSLGASLESALLCLLVTLAFAAWPLYEISQVRPAAVLRSETFVATRRTRILFSLGLMLCLFGLLWFLVADLKKAAWLSGSLFAVSAVTALCSQLLVTYLKAQKPNRLALRTALGSWRAPEARTELVVFILSTCLAVLYTAVFCEQALRQSWIEAMPPESPNLIFFDIQPGQVEAFKQAVGAPMQVYVSLNVRVQEINGKPIDRSQKRGYWSNDGRGKLDALPTLELPSNDRLVQGSTLYQGSGPDQVSIRRDLARALKVSVGDRLTLGIQGVPLSATISSIRSSTREGFKPSFELLFPPDLVEGAPSHVFATLRLAEDEVGPLQTRIAKAFPAVVSMDLSLTIKLIAERLRQMVGLVQVFLWSGLISGVLILISATWSARQRRARESAYYKVMGASMGFLNRVIWLESLMLGLTASGLGMALAVVTSWALCTWQLDVPFPAMGAKLAWMLLLPTLAITGLGWWVSRKVVATRPAPYLREE